MDPLSEVISLLKPSRYMFRGFKGTGMWSLHFPTFGGVRCYAVFSGECWLVLDRSTEAIRLSAGDCILLTRGQSFRLTTDPTLTPEDAVALFSCTPEGRITTINDGDDITGLGGYFTFAGRHAVAILAALPAIVHIRNEVDREALFRYMELVMKEIRHPQPGGSLIAQHLVHTMLVLSLRFHPAEAPPALGWLLGFTDKHIGAALAAMHNEPASRWTLTSLAKRAAMSRSTFAARFRQLVGEPPKAYLARWRMVMASDKLRNSNDTVSKIAYSLGYESESAFSAAFRREMGCSPREYARSEESQLFINTQL